MPKQDSNNYAEHTELKDGMEHVECNMMINSLRDLVQNLRRKNTELSDEEAKQMRAKIRKAMQQLLPLAISDAKKGKIGLLRLIHRATR